MASSATADAAAAGAAYLTADDVAMNGVSDMACVECAWVTEAGVCKAKLRTLCGCGNNPHRRTFTSHTSEKIGW